MEFSERTFGVCFDSEFCQKNSGLVVAYPYIPSQRKEKDLGYDVEKIKLAVKLLALVSETTAVRSIPIDIKRERRMALIQYLLAHIRCLVGLTSLTALFKVGRQGFFTIAICMYGGVGFAEEIVKPKDPSQSLAQKTNADRQPAPALAPTSPQTGEPTARLEGRNALETWGLVGGIVFGVVGVLSLLATKTGPWLRAKIDSHNVSRVLGRDFPQGDVEESIKYYIHPFSQDIDPSGGEEPREVVPVQQKLFDVFDKFVNRKTNHPFIIFLADSGMGKTSALIKYYLRQNRFWRRRTDYRLKLIALGRPNAIERIAEIQNKNETILLLDAFDEDTEAIADNDKRLKAIVDASRDFPRVLISCRTQFFRRESEIPKETGIMVAGPRRAGESGEYKFHKLYLSPFTDSQVDEYINRRFRLTFSRKAAHEMARKIPNLACRPMLLAHIDDLVKAKRDIKYSFELYEEMINAWADREDRWVAKNHLLDFSTHLAINFYENRRSRIPRADLTMLATKWNIPLDDSKLSTRSLLNRDADGNYKFAHRSIMEYLLVKRFVEGDKRFIEHAWTDEMHYFLWEMVQNLIGKGSELESFSTYVGELDSESQRVARGSLLARAAFTGLKRLNSPVVASDHENISQTMVQLCSLMLSRLNDNRVTLFDTSQIAQAHHRYTLISTRTSSALNDLPLLDWQSEMPLVPDGVIQNRNESSLLPGSMGKPWALYIPGERGGSVVYLLVVESSSEEEIQEFGRRYGAILRESLNSMPERPKPRK